MSHLREAVSLSDAFIPLRNYTKSERVNSKTHNVTEKVVSRLNIERICSGYSPEIMV